MTKVCSVCGKELGGLPSGSIHFGKCDACEFISNVSNDSKIPLLTIEVQDLHSVPVVKLNGQVIDGKMNVDYSYVTGGLLSRMQQQFEITYGDKTNNGVVCKTIAEKRQ